MNNLNFNYWLQGYFELMGPQDGNASVEVTVAQVKCIREHLNLVKQIENLNGFAAWLEGYLDAKVGLTEEALEALDYLFIAGKLTESFKHTVPQPWQLGIQGIQGRAPDWSSVQTTVC